MVTEDYVSFETAKLLKEKGFDEICLRTYFEDGKLSRIFTENEEICNRNLLPGIVSAPTIQMAMKWLREVHHFHIIPEISDGLRLNPQYYVVIWLTTSKSESYILDLFDSYEEACEEAIKYCLENLI